MKSTLYELHLFAGCGGGILGGILLGHEPVCAVEIEPYARKVLLARQRDGSLPHFPIWDDVRTFDGGPWRGIADVVCGGFPCQDISAIGKGAGIDGKHSGLWGEMRRVVCEVKPRFVFVENSPMLTIRGLGRVLGDLAALGYNAAWGVFSACAIGAPHTRERLWILAEPAHERHMDRQIKILGRWWMSESSGGGWWHTEPDMGRVADGMAHDLDRVAAIGNGQVPAVAVTAWDTLRKKLTHCDIATLL